MSFLNKLLWPPGNIKRLIEQIKTGDNRPIYTMDPILDELGKIGEPAVRPLCAVLKDQRSIYSVRCMAGIALVRIGSPSEEPLRAFLSDKNEEVRLVVSATLMTIQKGVQYKGALALLAYLKESEIAIKAAK
jgi:HEAT repeat protein